VFPNNLAESSPFVEWIKKYIILAIQGGEDIDQDTTHMSMLPTLEAKLYRSMYAYKNHIRVANVEGHLTTCDSGITTTFEHTCVSRPNDRRPIIVRLEYVGRVEEILELTYRALKSVMLLCNWVKANYNESNATIKQDKYDFTLVNFASLIPISYKSFVFPIHVEQMFLLGCDSRERGWKVVLRKEFHGQ
jgi:hypothetical protein